MWAPEWGTVGSRVQKIRLERTFRSRFLLVIVLHVCTYASNPTLATHGLGVFGSSRTWILFGAAISLRQPAYVNDCLNCKQMITSGIRNTDERIRALNCTCCALICILYFRYRCPYLWEVQTGRCQRWTPVHSCCWYSFSYWFSESPLSEKLKLHQSEEAVNSRVTKLGRITFSR